MAEEKKIRCTIPLDPACPEDKSVSIWINWYKYTVLRNTPVEIPETWLQIIEESSGIRAILSEDKEKITPDSGVRDFA